MTLRLTTDAPLDYILQETTFNLNGQVNLVLGPDETLSNSPMVIARKFEENTESYWRTWSLRLALQPEWQDAVVRAAITLKLCSYEPTGAIVAAMTTSIPEAPGSRQKLGLPVLLGPRRLLRYPRSYQPGRWPHPGELLPLAYEHRRAATPGTSSPCTALRLKKHSRSA